MTTTEAPPSPASAPSPDAGSASTERPDRHVCEVCGRRFRAKIGLFNHLKTHQRDPDEPIEPKIPVRKAAKPTKAELAEIQSQLAQNVRTVGQVLHPLLLNLKLLKLQNPGARFAVPGTPIDVPVPSFDTHLPYTLIARSEVTAKVLVGYAEENETLLRWLIRFNGWFKGGEVGELIGAHAVAVVATAGVENGVVNALAGALIGDVLESVQAENYELRQRVQELERQAGAWRAPGDERGAGN